MRADRSPANTRTKGQGSWGWGGLPFMDFFERRRRVHLVPRRGVQQHSSVKNLRYPTSCAGSIEFQGIFLKLSHRILTVSSGTENGIEPTPQTGIELG